MSPNKQATKNSKSKSLALRQRQNLPRRAKPVLLSIALLTFTLTQATHSSPIPGETLNPFNLKTITGTPWSWHPGRTTVFTFCALWCDTWKDQLPRVRAVRNATKGLPVDFATISVDGRWADRTHTDEGGVFLSDTGGSWSHNLGIDRVPYTLVVSPIGRISWAGYGTVRSTELIQAVRNASERPKKAGNVYLTFGDFPTPKGSYELLDLLRAKAVPATFFCIGSKLSSDPLLIKRAATEGHKLQILSNQDLKRYVAILHIMTTQTPDLYRPPGSEKLLHLDGTPLKLPIDDPYDYTRPGADEIVRRVLSSVRNGSVIQLHAGVEDTLQALPKIIENLRSRGFSFKILTASP